MITSRLVHTDQLVSGMSDNVRGAATPAARGPVTPVKARLEHLFRNTPLQGAALILCREVEFFRTRGIA